MARGQKGMTLVEVLTVVMILGVLATIVVPRYFGQRDRGAVAEAVQMLAAIRQGEEAYRMEFSGYHDPDTTGTWEELGMDTPSGINWLYTVDADASTFTATATRVTAGDCPGKTITISNTGTYGGSHPFGPNPDNGASCS